MSFYHQLGRSWRDDRPAFASADGVLSYAALRQRVDRARGWLVRRGLAPGDVLALQLPKGHDLLELHLAALSMGVITLPLNDRYTADEVRYALTDSGARLACLVDAIAARVEVSGATVVAASDLALLAEAPAPEGPPPPDDAPALLAYTSGTTGRPKGALITHANLAATVSALHGAWRWSDDDVLLHTLPLFHIHGLVVAQHGALWAGACTVWVDRFDATDVARAIAKHRASVVMGVPTHYHRLLALPDADFSSVRLFTSGSAPLPASDHRAFQARFGHAILERYGMTEVGIVLANPYDGERRPGTVGVPLPGVLARVVDDTGGDAAPGAVGELWIGGPSVFAGYLGRPDQTAEVRSDGWMRTGDLASRAADGYFTIEGRRTELLLVGGFNVYPREVESALLDHPGVTEAAVIGLPDADLGDRTVALVVCDASLAEEQLMAWCAERLAPYKRPRAIRRVDALPRNAMGKVDKAAVRGVWASAAVRPARVEEAPHIAAWNVAMAHETEGIALDPGTTLRGARAVFERPVGARYFRAEIDGIVVGQCMITTEWSDWRDATVWWLQSVYVAPDARGKGVYRALHEAVVSEAKAAGAAGLRLYVDRRNPRAAAVYRAVGMDGDHYLVFEQMFDGGDPDPDRR